MPIPVAAPPSAARMPGGWQIAARRLSAVTLIVICGLLGLQFATSYQACRREAQVTVSNLSDMLSANIQAAFDRAQSDLRVFAPEVSEADLSGAASPARRADIEARMGYHLQSFPAVLNYRIFNAEGVSVFGAGAYSPHVPINVADRAWFAQLRDDPARQLAVSEVVQGKSVPGPTVILAVPLRDAGGLFRGAVVAAINLAYFQNLVDGLDLGPQGLVAVRRTEDLRLVLRRPQRLEEINGSLQNGSGLSSLIANGKTADQGEFRSQLDQTTRTYALRTLSGYPLTIVVAVARADYLAGWSRQTALTAGSALLLLGGLAWLDRRRQKAQREILEQGRRYQAMLRIASDGIHVLDAEGRLVEASDSFFQMLGYGSDQQPVLSVADWDAHFPREQLPALLSGLLSGGPQVQVFETRHRRVDGSEFPVEVSCRPIDMGKRRLLYASSRDISARKQAERRLAESELRFRSLVEGISDWMWETDEQHRFSWLSPSFEKVFGAPSPAKIGQYRWSIAADIDEDASQRHWQAHLGDLAARRAFRDFRYWVADAAGRRRWISVSGAPRFDESGQFRGYRGTGADITEKAEMAARLRLLSTVVEELPVTVVVTDPAGKIQYVNRKACSLFGYDHEALLNRDMAAVCQWESAGTVWREIGETLRAGRSWKGEIRSRTPDGRSLWEGAIIFPIRGEEGEVSKLVSIIEDVTYRKEAEQRIGDLLAYQRALLANTPIGIAVFSAQRKCLQANPAFARIYGLAGRDLTGEDARILYQDEGQFRELGQRAYPQILRGATFAEDVPMRRHDGADIWVRLVARMVEPGAPELGVIWAAEDITRQKEMALNLQRINAELEQFAYVASHDLRQPLRMVTSYLGVIEKQLGPALDGELREYFAYAIGGARRMDRLILDLLEYSRTGQSAVQETVPLAEAVAEAVLTLEPEIREAQGRVTVAEGLPTVTGHPGELTRLFQNLIGNAIKYRAPGRPPQVEVGWRAEGGEWRLWVKDNGIGIAAADQERVFQLFQRLVPQDRYEGTGIGLAVAKKIVANHHGRLWIESAEGVGSTFFLMLPRALHQAEQTAKPVSPRLELAPAGKIADTGGGPLPFNDDGAGDE